MTWNVLFGGEDRFDRILALLAREKPDVLVLQECLGWEDGVRLGEAARALGLPGGEAHARLGLARMRGSGRRFHVALLSRFPILWSDTHADPARIGHVVLEATIEAPGGRIAVLGTHFDSHGEDERVRDARTLLTIAARERIATERLLLAGDLNALSPRDPYPPDLAEKVRAAGVDKYGHPPRFDTIPLLESAGWIDLLYARGAPAKWITAERDRGGVRIDYRTDYLFASPALAAHAQETTILSCEGASDHEPVVATFT